MPHTGAPNTGAPSGVGVGNGEACRPMPTKPQDEYENDGRATRAEDAGRAIPLAGIRWAVISLSRSVRVRVVVVAGHRERPSRLATLASLSSCVGVGVAWGRIEDGSERPVRFKRFARFRAVHLGPPAGPACVGRIRQVPQRRWGVRVSGGSPAHGQRSARSRRTLPRIPSLHSQPGTRSAILQGCAPCPTSLPRG